MKKLFLVLGMLFLSGQAYATSISFDQLAVSSDLTAVKYNSDLNTVYQKVNSNIQTDNIAADTVSEVDMNDDANPRLRDYELGGEGTECEFVYTGMLPTTTSGTLTGSIPAGTAYPRGYRIVKASGTSHTFTASKWTFVDIDTAQNFQYSEVSIGAATPAVAANSIRLARVSTDGTEVTAVQDLRTLSCTNAKPSTTREVTTEASLGQIFSVGTGQRKSYNDNVNVQGYVSGLFVSWDTHTTFKVTKGGAYINGKYRYLAADLTVTTGADIPSSGTSGIVTGSVGASATYNVYAVADQDATSSLSVSYGVNPTDLTNYRLIGVIHTDGSSLFTSGDITTVHEASPDLNQLVKGWINFNGTGTPAINNSYNVSGIVDDGTGMYTITWDIDFASADYAIAGTNRVSGSDTTHGVSLRDTADPLLSTAALISTGNSAGTKTDSNPITAMAIGDR